MRFSRPFMLEVLVIAIPVMVALAQIYLHLTSDLTPWKGGGYGMYTDPPPNKHHRIWLVGSGGKNQLLIGRKTDLLDTIRHKTLRNAFRNLYWDSKPFLYFPSHYDLDRIQKPMARIARNLEELGDARAVFVGESVTFMVTQTQISKRYDSLNLVPIFTVPINLVP